MHQRVAREMPRSGRFLRLRGGGCQVQVFRRKSRQKRRELDTKNSAAFLPVVAENLSTMLLNDAEANAQAQAGALPDGLGCIERIEDAMGILDPRTGVQEQDHDVATVANGFNGEHAAFVGFHGVEGVADDIEENLHELVSVATNAGENGLELKLDARGCGAQVESAKLDGVIHDGVEIEKGAFGGHLARKTEQVPYQGFGAARLVADFCCGGARFVRDRGIVGEQIGKAEDGGERIINFMSRAGGELPERDQFFGLHDLRLQAFQIVNRLL